MRIAVWHNVDSGGSKRVLYYHLRGLIDRGHTVEVWCPSTADPTYLPLEEFMPNHVMPLKGLSASTGSGVQKLLPQNRDIPSRVRALHRHSIECSEKINAGGFDLFFGNSCKLSAVAPIGRYVRIPKVLYLQEPYRMLYEARPTPLWAKLPPLSRPGAKAITRRLVQIITDRAKINDYRLQVRDEVTSASAYDRILVNSLFSRESILRAYGLDSRVCYLGIDTQLFQYKRLPRERFIVGVGAIHGAKNIELIVRAIGCLPEPRPTLLWIGNASYKPYFDYIRSIAEALKVPLEIRVRVTDNELVDLLNRASLMAYAPRLEPFGLAPLEANACGAPVVGVAEGGVRETILSGVNGLLTEHSPEALAAAISCLLSNSEYARELGESGHRIVNEKWSVEASVDRLEQQLEEVLEKKQQEKREEDLLERR